MTVVRMFQLLFFKLLVYLFSSKCLFILNQYDFLLVRMSKASDVYLYKICV